MCTKNYIKNGNFAVNRVLNHIKKEKGSKKSYIGKDGQEYLINMTSQRYELFKAKGCTCVVCGLKGTYFTMESNYKQYQEGKLHFNLYGVNAEGNEILITKDHIIPKSKGGKNHLENYQTMCYDCNQKKGNKY
jgi:5-methylcytosine-specific restriction endonuclease McrA